MGLSPASSEIVIEVELPIRDLWEQKFSGSELNSECCNVVEDGSRGIGVSLMSERGTTQTKVKVPKYCLSVKEVVFNHRQREGMLRSSNPMISV